MGLRDAQIGAGHQSVEGSWLAALREFRKDVEKINREIRDYNLKAPSIALHKFSMRVDEELAGWVSGGRVVRSGSVRSWRPDRSP